MSMPMPLREGQLWISCLPRGHTLDLVFFSNGGYGDLQLGNAIFSSLVMDRLQSGLMASLNLRWGGDQLLDLP